MAKSEFLLKKLMSALTVHRPNFRKPKCIFLMAAAILEPSSIALPGSLLPDALHSDPLRSKILLSGFTGWCDPSSSVKTIAYRRGSGPAHSGVQRWSSEKGASMSVRRAAILLHPGECNACRLKSKHYTSWDGDLTSGRLEVCLPVVVRLSAFIEDTSALVEVHSCSLCR